jgi:L-seryl-tRNA(Ser) seleniumtransferase
MSRARPGTAALRTLPSVDALLREHAAARLLERHPREVVVEALREGLDAARAAIRSGSGAPAAGALIDDAARRLEARLRPRLCRVINATGVILHTGLGRAPLPEAALDAIRNEARGYCLLETDRATGERAEREQCVRDLLTRLLGCAGATVVNNNAGAALLVLASLARGREVIVSRGELVEIGGGFRVPEVMRESGALLREVGTTNRTRIADYAAAVGDATALLMKVHRSNFKMVGFVEEVGVAELAALGRERGVPVVHDVGSGTLVDLATVGLRDEPVASAELRAGADLVFFSGDKLLGGPQCGIIAGRTELVQRARRHPLFRALRPDKLTLIALEATLKCHLDPDEAFRRVPTLRMAALPLEELRRRAGRLLKLVRAAAPGAEAELRDDVSEIGSGSVPGVGVPTVVVALRAGGRRAADWAAALRGGEPPVFARVKDDAVLLDPRTLLEGEDREVAAAVGRAAGG